jgi:hypothetical protein
VASASMCGGGRSLLFGSRAARAATAEGAAPGGIQPQGERVDGLSTLAVPVGRCLPLRLTVVANPSSLSGQRLNRGQVSCWQGAAALCNCWQAAGTAPRSETPASKQSLACPRAGETDHSDGRTPLPGTERENSLCARRAGVMGAVLGQDLQGVAARHGEASGEIMKRRGHVRTREQMPGAKQGCGHTTVPHVPHAWSKCVLLSHVRLNYIYSNIRKIESHRASLRIFS